MSHQIFTSFLCFAALISCQPPEATPPVPPDMEETAKKFFDLQGSLDAEKASALSEFMISDGGAAILGGGILLQSFLPEWSNSTNSGKDQDAKEDDPPFSGNGWMIITLLCAEEDSEFTFYSLFSQEGLEPYLWGEATNCYFGDKAKEDGLGIDGNIAFFLPYEEGYIAPTDWDGPPGVWMSLEGNLDFGEEHLSGEYHLMLDEADATQLLWENGSARFALLVDFDPESFSDPEVFLDLSLTIKTGEGDWECNYVTLDCTGPNGEELKL